jgi:hypothetical protein
MINFLLFPSFYLHKTSFKPLLGVLTLLTVSDWEEVPGTGLLFAFIVCYRREGFYDGHGLVVAKSLVTVIKKAQASNRLS